MVQKVECTIHVGSISVHMAQTGKFTKKIDEIQGQKKVYTSASIKSRIGEIVNAEVYQIWKNEILLQDDDGNDLILPKS